MLRWIVHPFGSQDGEVIEQLLIHRATHLPIERVGTDVSTGIARKIAAMVAYLQHSLRDEALLARYAQIETLRVEKLTYAIHVGELAVLFSVIAGKNTDSAVTRCRKQLETIHATRTVALGDFDPGNPPTGLLAQARPTIAT